MSAHDYPATFRSILLFSGAALNGNVRGPFRRFPGRFFPYLLVLVVAGALKAHYSRSDANGLTWILAPTAFCVELASGIPFTFKRDTGFINLDRRAVIAPACAGINFMIIAFCMFGFVLAGRFGSMNARLLSVVSSLPAAFCLTIAVNTLRIVLSLYLYEAEIGYGWFTQERIHRLAGTVIYFASLFGMYAVVVRVLGDEKKPVRKGAGGSGAQSAARRFLTPAAWYLAVTLAFPLALGKGSMYPGRLFEHGCSVLLVLAAAAAFYALYRQIYAGVQKKSGRKGVSWL